MVVILSTLQIVPLNNSLFFTKDFKTSGYLDTTTYYALVKKKGIKVLLFLCAIKHTMKSYELERHL